MVITHNKYFVLSERIFDNDNDVVVKTQVLNNIYKWFGREKKYRQGFTQ